MTSPARPLVINKLGITINFAMLATMLGGVGAGVHYFSRIDVRLQTQQHSIDAQSKELSEVRMAIDRVVQQMVTDGRALAIVQTMVISLDKRVDALEAKTRK